MTRKEGGRRRLTQVSGYLDVALFEQGLVAVGGRPGNVGSLVLAVGSETFIEQEAGGFKMADE